MDELLARIRAGVRRGDPTADNRTSVVDHRRLHHRPRRPQDQPRRRRGTPHSDRVVAARTLARHPGKLVPQKQLLTEIWGPTAENESHYLRVYIAQLRRKLEPDPAHPRYLITEPGAGYRFETGPPAPRPEDPNDRNPYTDPYPKTHD